MSRADVRAAAAAYMGGTYSPSDMAWRGGPLTADGLGTVRYWSKRIPDDDFTAGQAPGRGMGAVMVVHISGSRELRQALGGPTSGWKNINYAIKLYIFHKAWEPRSEIASDDVDQLIQSIIDHIHADRTLGTGTNGVIVEAGEDAAGITVSHPAPVVSGEITHSEAIISFNTLEMVMA